MEQSMLEHITTLGIFHFFIVFCRIGSAMMFMPGFGEVYVNPRTRLGLSIAVSIIIMPVIEPSMPLLPDGVLPLFLAIMPEIMIGLFIGAIARMLQGILHIAGMMIAFQSSLASALLFDANQASQGSVVGNFMTLIGLTLIFVTNMHHMILAGIADSYSIFPPAVFPPVYDFSQLASKTLSGGFVIAVKISAPLIITGLSLYLGAGIMGRLMPNMQVFFVMIPLQLYISFTMLVFTFTAGMMIYMKYFEEVMMTIFAP